MRAMVLAVGVLVMAGCGSDEGVQSPNAGGAGGGASTGATGGGGSAGSAGASGGMAGASGSAGIGGEGGGNQVCADACDVFQTCDDGLDVTACVAQCNLEVTGGGYLSLELAERFFADVVTFGTDTGCGLTRSDEWWVAFTRMPGYTSTFKDQQAFNTCRAETVCARTEPALSENCFFHFYRYNDSIREKTRACLGLCSKDEPWNCISEAVPEGRPWIAGVSPL